MKNLFQTSVFRFLSILVILSFVFVAPSPVSTASASTDPAPVAPDGGVMFIENVGQSTGGARYQVRGRNSTIWLAEDALWVCVLKAPDTSQSPAFAAGEEPGLPETPRQGANIKLSFDGANPHPTLEPFNRLETSVNYFIGNDPDQWKSNVPAWGGVRYKDLYPGIDLEVSSENGQVVQRVVASEGADLSGVKLHVEGAEEMALEGGQLLLTTPAGKYTLPLLQVSGVENNSLPSPSISDDEVLAPFGDAISGAGMENVRSGASDLLYSTFLGGSGNEDGRAIAVDTSGAAFVTGYTASSDFPTTPGAFDTSFNGDVDIFVVKMTPDGSALSYATFLGGGSY
jgi:hypothetical protein